MSSIIHIGYPKAASTWLQCSVFPAVKNYILVEETLIAEKLLKPGSFVFDPDECKNYFSMEFKRPLLISEERFMGSFNLGWNNGAYTKELSGRLKYVFPDANIILVIRNQADIIASAYAQYIKDGGTVTINKYLYPPENFTFQNILKFSFEHLEYDRIIRHFNALFPERVRVFLFEELQDNPAGFIQRLRIELGLQIEEKDVSYNPRNRRYSAMILANARRTNIFTRNGSLNKYYFMHIPGYHAFSKRLWNGCNRSGLFGKPGSTEKVLGRRNYERINSYFAQSNRNLGDFVPAEILKKHKYPV